MSPIEEEDTTIADKQNSPKSTTNQIQDFFKQYWHTMLLIPISVFTIGTIGLYMTKVANAAILPGSSEIPTHVIYANATMVDDKMYGQKMLFNPEKFLSNYLNKGLITKLKETAATTKDTPNVANYFYKVFDSVVKFNSSVINSVFSLLGNAPDSVVMFIYGLGWYIFVTIFYFVSMVACFVFHISHLLDDTLNTDGTTNKSSDIEMTNMANSIDGGGSHRRHGSMGRKILMYIILIILTFISLSGIGPIFFMIYTLILPLTAKYKIENKDNRETPEYNNLLDFMCSTIIYKKIYFLGLTLFSLIYSLIQVIGWIGVLPGGCIIAAVFAAGFMLDSVNSQKIPTTESFVEIKHSGGMSGGGGKNKYSTKASKLTKHKLCK